MLIRATNAANLLTQIQANPASVSPRGQIRTILETEPWIVQRIISALASTDLLEYPLELEPSNRPDLILGMPSGQVGVEITEIVPPVYAQATAIRNQYYPEALIDRSLFGWGATFTAQQIHEHFRSNPDHLTGPGWAGEGVESEWARATESSVARKLERLNVCGFTVFQRNWLAAYASSPGPALDHLRAAGLVTLPSPIAGFRSFEKVLVLSGKCLVIFDAEAAQVRIVRI